MGHSHLPAPRPVLNRVQRRAESKSRRRAVLILAAVLVPIAVLTVVAMTLLWPSGNSNQTPPSGSPYAAAEGSSFHTGTVEKTATVPCPGEQQAGMDCFIAYTSAEGGADVPVVVAEDVLQARGVHNGDKIRYLKLPDKVAGLGPQYIFMDFVRTVPLALLTVLYVLVVLVVARWRGFRAMVGLIGAFAIIGWFIIPGLIEGKPPLLIALVGSSAIMFGVLYFAHGFTVRTSTALLGTLFGLLTTAGLAFWAVDAARLTGTTGDEAYQLLHLSQGMTLSGMILCGLIISGLGVLNDVTITQSSAVWELYELAPQTSARSLFTSAMRIGRDHIASTVYTIAFAYAGSALPVLILVSLYDRPLLDTLTSPQLAEEVVHILVGSIGLVLAIPVTTIIAVLLVKATGKKPLATEPLVSSTGVAAELAE